MSTDIAVVLYEGMTALDAVGPLDVLRFLPGAHIEFVATAPGPVTTDSGLSLLPTATLDDVARADVVVVPGGPGTAQALTGSLPAWLREIHPTTRWTTSVCSGALLLGAAGLLAGAPATTHFAVRHLLPHFGAEPDERRVVVDRERHVITAAGVSAGIDMALGLAELLGGAETADGIRLIVEYDPQPPRPGGSLATAPPQVVARAVDLARPHGALPPDWTPDHH